MLTLTVDPTLFERPRDAYFHVRERRALGVLIQALHRAGVLHSRRFWYVVEFQKYTEMPHYHVLVDASFIPKDLLDREWSKNRPARCGPPPSNRPAFGMTRISQRSLGDPEHAAAYVTKYLTKPDCIPGWVLDLGAKRRVLRFSHSRRLFPRKKQQPRRLRRAASKRGQSRSYRQRATDCGQQSVAFVVGARVNEFGELVREERRYAGAASLTADDLSKLADGKPTPLRGSGTVSSLAQDAATRLGKTVWIDGHPRGRPEDA
ncbi:MAG: hypothetical protein AAFX79_03000 [Planctomycetota bacterium]